MVKFWRETRQFLTDYGLNCDLEVGTRTREFLGSLQAEIFSEYRVDSIIDEKYVFVS